MNNLKTIGVISLGCPKNTVDTEIMLGKVLSSGYTITNDITKAGTVIINTCSFIEAAKNESRETIEQILKLKKLGKILRIIVMGCLVQEIKEKLLDDYPDIDLFLGTFEFQNIAKILDEDDLSSKRLFTEQKSYIYNDIMPRVKTTPPHFAYVKISEGCSKRCSFCIIPKLRGPLQSRPISVIRDEVNELTDAGVKEISIISQETNSYGSDLRNGTSLIKLLETLLKNDALKWIRLMYLYPYGIRDELISLIKRENKLCNYLDMPIQHISNSVLKNMYRSCTGKSIREILTKLKSAIPDLMIRTTLMVGFPGETDADFQELLEFVNEFEFAYMGAFKYSNEKTAASYHFDSQIPEKIKEERFHQLMTTQQTISLRNNTRLIGKQFSAVVESVGKNKTVGRIQTQAPDIDGITVIKGKNLKPSTFINVKITHANHYDLVAEVIKKD